MLLFLDIETIPSQHPDALPLVRAGLKPPAQLKKPESIRVWWENEAEAAAVEAWRKQSLDGGSNGEIISVACVSDTGREWVSCRPRPGEGQTEAELLAQFIAVVDGWTKDLAAELVPGVSDSWPIDDHFLVAHNAAFDVPYLWRRCIVNRVAVPNWLPGPTARNGSYGCTMLAWSGFSGRISLGSLCRALGVTSPKDGMDGSKVFDAWQDGHYEAIARYNLQDVRATAEVWHILQGRGAV